MTRRLGLLLFVLAACVQAGASSASPGSSRGRSAPGPRTAPDGRVYAVVSTELLVQECSGMGGEHYVFTVDDPAARAPVRLHAGGHGVRLGLLPEWGHQPTRWFVAEISRV